MSNFEKNPHYGEVDEESEFVDSINILEDEYPAVKFTKVGGFKGAFGANGVYDDLDFYMEFKHGEAKLTIGKLASGHQIPSNMYESAVKVDINHVVPTDLEFENMFMLLMDSILDNSDLAE